MTYVTSDLHGYPLSLFIRLLDKAGFMAEDTLIVLGDVIDRNGDGGVAMLRWMISQANVRLIRGNHEQMFINSLFLFADDLAERAEKLTSEEIWSLYAWKQNGADATLDALRELLASDRPAFEQLRDAVLATPLYLTLTVNGKEYILTHSGLGNYAPEKTLEEYTDDELLWTRPTPEDRYDPEKTVVFGHTPTGYYGREYADRMLRTPTWIDIDTGAAGGRAPMLLRLEDEKPFYGEIPEEREESIK